MKGQKNKMKVNKTQCLDNNNKYLSKNVFLSFLLGIIISLVSIIAAIIVVFDSNVIKYYKLIFLLPLSFGVISIIFINLYKYFFKILSITIVISMYFIRMVIVPLVMRYGNYGFEVYNIDMYNNISLAIILMIYELICVFVILGFYSRKFKKLDKNFIIDFNSKEKEPFSVKFIIVIMAMFIIISLILFPKLKYQLTSIKQLLPAHKKELFFIFRDMRESTPGLIYWPYSFFLNILRTLIPIYVLKQIYIKLALKGKKNIALVLSLIVSIISFCFMTEEKAFSIFISATCFVVIYYIYKEQMRKIAPILGTVGIIAIIIAFIFKTGVVTSSNALWDLSAELQEYFSGPANIALSLNITSKANIITYIADICNSLPLLTYFFMHLPTSRLIFNQVFYDSNMLMQQDKIIPMIGQGFYYFGYFLAPIFSVICIYFAMKFNLLMLKVKKPLQKYTYILALLVFSVSPVMYNVSIIWLYIFYLIIPLILLTKYLRFRIK